MKENEDNNAGELPQFDPCLELLLKCLRNIENKTDGMLFEGITLCVNGLIITGIPTTFREWSRGHPIQEELNETLDKIDKQDKVPPNTDGPIYHIHLKNAFVYGAATHPIPTNSEGMFWRCRINSVDAFSLGTIGQKLP